MSEDSSPTERPTDLQFLLPKPVRDQVVAVPRRSLNLSIVSFSLVAMAAGLALGGWIVSGQARSVWIAVLVLGSLGLAAVIRRHEVRLLRRLERFREREESPGELD